MLALRPNCEHCGADLPPDTDSARICTFECTFCRDCATWEFLGICPNCAGELVTRPRRPITELTASPASTEVVHNEHDVDAHQHRVLERLVAGDLPEQTWAVSFVNEQRPNDTGYAETAQHMDELAQRQPGFLGVDSVRGDDGIGITVSRWSSIAALVAWRKLGPHAQARGLGRAQWYATYRSDVARVERTAEFRHPGADAPATERQARP